MSSDIKIVSRGQISGSTTKPFLTSYDWDFENVSAPKLINEASWKAFLELLRLRTLAVTVPEDPQNVAINVFIQGHRYSQPGDTPNYGQFSIQFQDFGDQAIQKFATQMVYSMSDPWEKTIMSNPRDFLFDIDIFRLDPQRKRVKRWRCCDCMLVYPNVDDTMSSDKQPVGSGFITFSCDHFVVDYAVNNVLDTTDPQTRGEYKFNTSSGAK